MLRYAKTIGKRILSTSSCGRPFQIAIDGPAASGKSSTATGVASHLGYLHFNSGSLYRAITLKTYLENPKNFQTDLLRIERIASETQFHFTPDGKFTLDDDLSDISAQLRSRYITQNVGIVAALPNVRKVLGQHLVVLASDSNLNGVVVDGRDIGTNVLPNANVKIYLTASLFTRAQRRLNEIKSSDYNDSTDLDQIMKEIEQRDKLDTTREFGKLCIAPDAIIIDSTDLTMNEVIAKIVNLAREKGSKTE